MQAMVWPHGPVQSNPVWRGAVQRFIHEFKTPQICAQNLWEKISSCIRVNMVIQLILRPAHADRTVRIQFPKYFHAHLSVQVSAVHFNKICKIMS